MKLVGDSIDLVPRTIYVIVGVLEVLFGVLGNFLILFVIFKSRLLRKHTFYNIFVANLALADLLTLGYWLPFVVLDLVMGYHPVVNEAHCTVNGVIISICTLASILSLVAISLNRYLHVCHSRLYRLIFIKRTTIACCVMVWLLSAVIALPPFFVPEWKYVYHKISHACIFSDQIYSRTMVAIMLVGSTLCTGYFNFAIFRTWKEAKRNLRQKKTDVNKRNTSAAEVKNHYRKSLSFYLRNHPRKRARHDDGSQPMAGNYVFKSALSYVESHVSESPRLNKATTGNDATDGAEFDDVDFENVANSIGLTGGLPVIPPEFASISMSSTDDNIESLKSEESDKENNSSGAELGTSFFCTEEGATSFNNESFRTASCNDICADTVSSKMIKTLSVRRLSGIDLNTATEASGNATLLCSHHPPCNCTQCRLIEEGLKDGASPYISTATCDSGTVKENTSDNDCDISDTDTDCDQNDTSHVRADDLQLCGVSLEDSLPTRSSTTKELRKSTSPITPSIQVDRGCSAPSTHRSGVCIKAATDTGSTYRSERPADAVQNSSFINLGSVQISGRFSEAPWVKEFTQLSGRRGEAASATRSTSLTRKHSRTSERTQSGSKTRTLTRNVAKDLTPRTSSTRSRGNSGAKYRTSRTSEPHRRPSRQSRGKPGTYRQQILRRRQKHRARERAMVRTLFVVFLLMVFCFLPYAIVRWVARYYTVTAEVYMGVSILILLHNSVNWIVYGLMNHCFRREYMKLFNRLIDICACCPQPC